MARIPPSGLVPSKMIRIKGVISSYIRDYIEINLQPSPIIDTPEISLHLSIRFNDFAIVRNHKQEHYWGPEEREGGFPLSQGQPFEIIILAEHNRFKVAVNGRHFCEFNYRLPLGSAQFLYINGPVTISTVTIEGDLPPSAPPMLYGSSASSGNVNVLNICFRLVLLIQLFYCIYSFDSNAFISTIHSDDSDIHQSIIM